MKCPKCDFETEKIHYYCIAQIDKKTCKSYMAVVSGYCSKCEKEPNYNVLPLNDDYWNIMFRVEDRRKDLINQAQQLYDSITMKPILAHTDGFQFGHVEGLIDPPFIK